MRQEQETPYRARTAYLDRSEAERYESARFAGLLGRYRWRREQRGVTGIVDMLPSDLQVLDCPCGIGRWWPVLERRASSIHALDISPAMVSLAKDRVTATAVPVEITLGDAENLRLESGAVDVVFSHALMKHLPFAVQQRVLAEFSRVTRGWVVCSFSLLNHLTYEIWRRRLANRSFALLPEQLREMTAAVGLSEVARRRCTTPVGIEYSVLLRKVANKRAGRPTDSQPEHHSAATD